MDALFNNNIDVFNEKQIDCQFTTTVVIMDDSFVLLLFFATVSVQEDFVCFCAAIACDMLHEHFFLSMRVL